MRFLLDENLSPRIRELLVSAGHAAVHVRDEGMAGSPDGEVLAHAASADLVLVTADRGDFGRELAMTGACRPAVVLLRQLPAVVRAADVAALLLANLTPDVVSALTKGAFVVLTPRAVGSAICRFAETATTRRLGGSAEPHPAPSIPSRRANHQAASHAA